MAKALIPQKELDAIRAHLAQTLPDKCVILELTQTADGQGGFTDAWTAAGTVNCRIDNSGGGRSNVGAAERTYSAWTLTIPHDAGLTTASRVQTGGYTYAVTDLSDSPSWVGVMRAKVERVE